MLLKVLCLLAFHLHIVFAQQATQLIEPGGSVMLSIPLATAHPIPRDNIIDTSIEANIREIQVRDQVRLAQYILGPCPELFSENNVAVQHCSSCGGENPASLGYCLERNKGNRICKCTNDGQGANGITTSLITITENGETATGTFELETFTQCSGLRQSITATTTVSTTTEGGTGLETAAVVVFAGGVAWFLADIGGSAAVVASLPNPETPGDHQDDKTCPNPKDQCNDCGAHQQMCTTGLNKGCACEEIMCPTDGSDEQPWCETDSCASQDGKCTTGDYKGCEFSPLGCPEIDHFWCIDCGGPDENGRCKGDPKYDSEFRGCDCKPEPDWSQAFPPLKRYNVAEHQAILLNLPNINPKASKPQPTPGVRHPECDTDQISGVRSSTFKQEAFNGFCDAIKNGDKSKPFTQIVDIRGAVAASKSSIKLYQRKPPVNSDLDNDYKFELTWTGGDNTCSSNCTESFNSMTTSPCGYAAGDQNIMTRSEYFLSAVNECNTDTRTKKYGSKPLIWNSPRGCIDFNIYGNGHEYSAAPFS